MAESVLFNLASKIIGALSSSFYEEISGVWGVGSELEKLNNTVSTIRAVLLDAEEKSYKSHQVKNWLERLKDALYDAEDLLGEISVDTRLKNLRSQNKVVQEARTFFSSSNQLIFRLTIANKLKEVIKKIDAIKADKPLHLEERTVNMGGKSGPTLREPGHLCKLNSEVIGRDDDKGEIIRLLMDSKSEENVSVVSIVGIGGLGKTALAQYVYHDEAIQKHFEITMWVCVSDFIIETIVANIIESAKGKTPEGVGPDQMQKTLQKEIVGKRYLLVLDDSWNKKPEEWRSLKYVLRGGAPGSKILITTRSEVVAKAAESINSYLLRKLSSRASLELFMAVASGKSQEISESEKVLIGEEIVEKCSRIPLAIRAIGGMLFFERTLADWLYFKEKKLQNLKKEDNDITAILKLSYDHLPSHLKQCFAFCSLFPKDYSIRKPTLISCWISQGFVQPSSNLDDEDIAHGYFMDLLQRNFFQDVKCNEFDSEIECKMHDLLHDLAYLMAGVESRDIKEAQPRTRHISYGSNRELSDQLPELQHKNTKVRMLLPATKFGCLDLSVEGLSKSVCLKILSDFKCLRFLALHDTNMRVVPRSLCKLKHLSHLDLSYNWSMKRLPSSIKGLQNLVTLKLDGCESLVDLPSDIGSLGCLKHLSVRKCSSMIHMPQSLGQLTSLHTLTCFTVGASKFSPKNYAKLSDLSGLNNLRGGLEIEISSPIKNAAVESKKANIKAKHSLDRLIIRLYTGEHNKDELIKNEETILEGLEPHTKLRIFHVINYSGARFPQWIMEDIRQCLPNLEEIVLHDCKYCQFLPPLGLLPRLKRLYLRGLSALESITNNNSPSSSNSSARQRLFPSLSDLTIDDCPKLKTLPLIQDLESLSLNKVSEELLELSSQLQKLKSLSIEGIDGIKTLSETWLQSLSSLETLAIKECPNLTSLSPGMQYLSSLECLVIGECEVLDLSIDENNNVMQHLDQGLRRLRQLQIMKLPRLTSLPDWLFHVTTLKELELIRCPNIMSLSNRIGDLTSLQKIEIIDCENLTSLPQSMDQLKSLEYLNIVECPELGKKCKKDSGEEWHRIAHVPNVVIGWDD